MNSLSVSVMAVSTVLMVLVAAQVWLLWRLTRVLGSAASVEQRLGHFGEALSLLTETTESGFRAVADELGRRRDDIPSFLQSRAATSRVAAAARRGRSVTEIAAAEEVSEGEVRLRLHLGGQTGHVPKTAASKAAPSKTAKTPAKTIAIAKPAARARRPRTEAVDDLRA